MSTATIRPLIELAALFGAAGYLAFTLCEIWRLWGVASREIRNIPPRVIRVTVIKHKES